MIKGNRFQCSQELLLNEEFAPNLERQLIIDVADALEESVLACMAAGIPENLISVERPYNARKKRSDPYRVEANLSFTGKLN